MSSSNQRPSASRAVSLQSQAQAQYKHRAASQPAGERVPLPTAPTLAGGRQGAVGLPANPVVSGRGSLNGDLYGVIGGSRTPGRFAGALAAGTQTRANSFSAGEVRDRNSSLVRTLSSHTEEHPSRTSSASPYPTFSPSSSPSASPSAPQLPLPQSPPKASANVSRSRSQSLATGHRPGPMGLSALDPIRTFDKGWDTSPPEGGNHSPFSRHPPNFDHNPRHDFTRGWGTSAPDSSQALSSSVAKALGGVQTTTIGFDTGGTGGGGAGGGGKSGASSRRHSVSVVGGGFGRRDFLDGQGMTMTSPPRSFGHTDADLLPDRLNNALSLEIDESRRRGIEIEVNPRSASGAREIPLASSLPGFERSLGSSVGRKDPFAPEGPFGFSSSPNRGRLASLQPANNRGDSGSREGSTRSRFSFEQPIGSPARQQSEMDKAAGAIGAGVPRPPPPPLGGPGAIGGPAPGAPVLPGYDPRYAPMGPGPGSAPGSMYRPSPSMYGPPSPIQPYAYTRPNPTAYPFYPRPMPQMPMYPPPPSHYQSPPFSPPHTQAYAPSYFPSSPTLSAPPLPGSTSPSFSSLSLSDLGKGIPLTALPPSTPLYIVAFKAGRRDVYYCPDPTLLISTTDRVIVEADRGSDLGSVVFDQLTPVDVREWQERQATAALLSGASQHQPPGMSMATSSSGPSGSGSTGTGIGASTLGGGGSGGVVKEGDLKGSDMSQLLAGCGPSGNAFETGMVQRGPLAKEIMPKRIFAKSSQGPDEQARMLEKRKDEYEAMMICREKVAERGLPMQIVDAEYQWDRRKLTFYFKADRRVDFRELTKENFRIFKSRIWMSMVPKEDPRR